MKQTGVDDYLEGMPAPRRRLMQFVRQLFILAAPEMKEKLSYGIPFFSRHSWIGYLNPTDKGLDVGFTRGHLLSDTHERLEVRDRKIVRSVMLAWDESPASVEAVLMPVLQEALLVDEWQHEQKKKPGKRK